MRVPNQSTSVSRAAGVPSQPTRIARFASARPLHDVTPSQLLLGCRRPRSRPVAPFGSIATQPRRPIPSVGVKNCQVQNDGSTFCDYFVDGKFATHGCFSDWDGGYCNGDEVED